MICTYIRIQEGATPPSGAAPGVRCDEGPGVRTTKICAPHEHATQAATSPARTARLSSGSSTSLSVCEMEKAEQLQCVAAADRAAAAAAEQHVSHPFIVPSRHSEEPRSDSHAASAARPHALATTRHLVRSSSTPPRTNVPPLAPRPRASHCACLLLRAPLPCSGSSTHSEQQ
jgi:hypothetical protein